MRIEISFMKMLQLNFIYIGYPEAKLTAFRILQKIFLYELDDLKSGLTELLERKRTLVEGGGIVCVIICMSYIK